MQMSACSVWNNTPDLLRAPFLISYNSLRGLIFCSLLLSKRYLGFMPSVSILTHNIHVKMCLVSLKQVWKLTFKPLSIWTFIFLKILEKIITRKSVPLGKRALIGFLGKKGNVLITVRSPARFRCHILLWVVYAGDEQSVQWSRKNMRFGSTWSNIGIWAYICEV